MSTFPRFTVSAVFMGFALILTTLASAGDDAAPKSVPPAKAVQKNGADKEEEQSFQEKMTLAVMPVLITGLLGLAGTIITAVITYKIATRDKSSSMSQLNHENVNLGGTEWDGALTDNDAAGTEQTGTVTFQQFGNRLIGQGIGHSIHRRWTLEGVISNRRVCYIYHDDDPKVVSFGTAMLELNAKGDTLSGVWNGWGPGGNQFKDLPIILKRHKK